VENNIFIEAADTRLQAAQRSPRTMAGPLF
jgi:hypothetical protein